MKFGSLIESSIEELGLRFSLVNILPSAALFLYILTLFWSGAPKLSPKMNRIQAHVAELDAAEGIYLAIAIVIIALIFQPLQLRLVKILEGYWGNSRVAKFIWTLGIRIQNRHRMALVQDSQISRTSLEEIDEQAKDKMLAAGEKLRQYFPAEDRLMPTALGNVLRAAEDLAGKRYGLDSVVVWPRLYPLISDRLASMIADYRNQLDIAARFCVVFFLAAIITLALLINHGWWLFIVVVHLLFSWMSYKSCLAAALAYGIGIQAAFDLHRFDLYKSMHLSMPEDRESEKQLSVELCDFLRQGVPKNFKYVHGSGE